jgi:methyl-accepting chemotaxis protein
MGIEEMNHYGMWIESNFNLLIFDSRFSDILSLFNKEPVFQSKINRLQENQNNSIIEITQSVATMLSEVFKLMELLREALSDKTISSEMLKYYLTVYDITQRLFMEIMSANLQIISSRFITSTEISKNILLLSNSISQRSSSLKNLLRNTGQNDLINDYYENEKSWLVNVATLLENDERKRVLIKDFQLSRKKINVKSDYLLMFKILFMIIIPLLLLLVSSLFFLSTKKLSIVERKLIKNINTLEKEKDSLKRNYNQIFQEKKASDDRLADLEKDKIIKEESLLDMTVRLEESLHKIEGLTDENKKLKAELATLSDAYSKPIEDEKLHVLSKYAGKLVTLTQSTKSLIQKENGSVKVQEEIQHIESLMKKLEDLFAETRLLSLNAAVESARAGEKGKGFGIVADKIREISEKSQRLSKTLKETTLTLSKNIQQNHDLEKEDIISALEN